MSLYYTYQSFPLIIFHIFLISNRNYKPRDEALEEVALPAVEPAKVEDLVKQQLNDGEKAKEEVQVSSIRMHADAKKRKWC